MERAQNTCTFSRSSDLLRFLIFFRLRCVHILLTLTNSDNRYLTKHTYRMFAQGMHLKAYSQVVGIGAHRIFSRGGQIRGSGDESPPAGSRGGALVGV